jgi:hypothetical protein
MRTFELSRVQTAHQRGARFLHGADLSSSSQQLPLFGIGARGFWTAKEDIEPRFFVLASYAAGEEPARSFGGIYKAQNSLRTSGTLMYQPLLALNRQSSYLQQAPPLK